MVRWKSPWGVMAEDALFVQDKPTLFDSAR